jgi:cyanate permease
LLGIFMASGPAPVPYGVVISHWFDRHRGLALALSMMGIGIGSIVVPILSQRLIAAFGWRMTLAIFGGATLVIPLPIVAALLQNDPAERGLHPDGDEGAVDPALRAKVEELPGFTWREIWHSPSFWVLLCIFSLAGAAVHGVALHMAAILTDRGISPERAALATSLMGGAVIVGRLGSGYLLDRLFAPHVAILLYGATAVGTAILCTGTVGTGTFVAAFLAGLGMGAEVESMGYMISRYFGLHSFGAAYGHAFGAFMLAGAAGVWLMGAGSDRYHSYTVPLAVLCGAMVLALVLLSRLGPYRFAPETALVPGNSLEVPTRA